MRGERLVQGRCTVGSIRDANRGPRAPLAALIPLLHQAPSSATEREISICLFLHVEGYTKDSGTSADEIPIPQSRSFQTVWESGHHNLLSAGKKLHQPFFHPPTTAAASIRQREQFSSSESNIGSQAVRIELRVHQQLICRQLRQRVPTAAVDGIAHSQASPCAPAERQRCPSGQGIHDPSEQLRPSKINSRRPRY